MRCGILSDIHGNLEALQTVLDCYKEAGIKDFFCLGDIVGYGANPKECLSIIRDLNAVCIAGNHDWAVSGKFSADNFNAAAKEAVEWTRAALDPDDIAYLNNLGLVFKDDAMLLVHGTLSEPERFHYMMYMSDAIETFHLMDRPVCFVGHTHAPHILMRHKESIENLDPLTAPIDPARQYIVNVGSVGQPRDGDPMAAYCIYDTDTCVCEVKRAPYDIETAQKKILEAGLPASLAQRLALGR